MQKIVMCAALATLFAACNTQQPSANPMAEWSTQDYANADSTDNAVVNLNVTLPLSVDSASSAARQFLLSAMAQLVITDYNADAIAAGRDTLKPFAADTSAVTVVAYYGRQLHRLYKSLATAEIDTQRHNIETAIAEADSTDTLALKIFYDELDALEQPTPWSYTLSCTAGDTTATYAVYDIGGYAENGGAHGHALTSRHLIIDRQSGQPLTHFFANGAERRMQPLLRKGLVDYFNCEGDGNLTERTLFSVLSLPKADGTVIPLPQRTPVISGDSLFLVYGEEEITPHGYAEPTVALSLSEAKAYLSPEALRLLGLEAKDEQQ